MTNLAARVRRFAQLQQLWTPGARVAVALSGGSDSVALLALLQELAAAGDVAIAGVAHLNHQLRVDADRDEAFCRTLALRAGLPFDVERTNVAELARERRCSIEVAARRARYGFFDGARKRLEAEAVAVAHTRDDQAETVLLRLIRGAGTRGLRGMLPVRGTIVRPLLECTHAKLRAYLADRGDAWVEDLTNADLANLRNRIRHELLPLLTTRYQPGMTRLLARSADLARHDDDYLEERTGQAARRVTAPAPTGVRIVPSHLLSLPLALQRRVIRHTLEAVGAARGVRMTDIERLLTTCRSASPSATMVAGLRVERFPADDVLVSRGEQPGAAELPARLLRVPGAVDLPEVGSRWRLCAVGPTSARLAPAPTPHRAVLDLQLCLPPFVVRSRRAGDRMRPLGTGGSKKLQDLMVDRKVPRSERDLVPVVADGTGRIVWVVGLALSEDVVATERSNDVVVLSFERLARAGPEAS